MTRLMKHEEKEPAKETGRVVPFRSAFPEIPRMMERLDELLMERWAPFWPTLRIAEELLPRVPPVDVYEEGNEVVLKAELPGMKKEEIEVHVAGAEITFSGRKEKTEKLEKKDYHRYERSTGAFTRTVMLPAEVEIEKVTAKYENGVLEIRAPKAAPAKPAERKVEIA
jgi:HSP20 family protein